MPHTKAIPFLECEQSFRDATPEFIAEICNGCGARDGIDVPDTIWGMSITRACNIHDWDYQLGKTTEAKDAADDRFRRNIQSLIDFNYCYASAIQRFLGIRRLLRWLRGWRAQTYYLAVHYHGSSAFWAGKD